MPSKTLMAVWAFFDFAMLAAGGVAIAMSIIWRAPDVLREIVISDRDLTAGMVLGIAYVLTFVISVGGVVQRNHVTRGLVILNWALIIDGMFTVVIGCMVWFWTLRERVNFQGVWAELSSERRQALQDKLSCCGYMDPKDMLVNAGFCADPTFASTQPGCVDPITSFADSTLRSIFTTVFGYMAVVMALFLATLCVINKRIERERFRKIDAKRGGRGFV